MTKARNAIRSVVPTLIDPFELGEQLLDDTDILEVWEPEQYALVLDDEDIVESTIRPVVRR